jgi:hypothetical protein
MQALLSVLALVALLVMAPVAQAGGRGDKPYACNPQKECLARAAGLKGAAAETAKRDCNRMPTSGTCYGAPAEAPADRSERGKKK